MVKILCLSLTFIILGFLSLNFEAGKVTAAAPIVISSGGYHTCALLDNGRIKCWGFNGYGQLGQGDTANKGDGTGEMGDNLGYIDLGINGIAKEISNGLYHTCALLNGGEVKCWGSNQKGQLGQGSSENQGDSSSEMGDSLQPISLGTSKTATQISAGHTHTCALLNDGTVKCWGNGHDGRLGQGNTSYIGLKPNQMGDNLPSVNLGSGLTATSIAAGGNHTCALLNNGQVKCWGANNYGQLGIETTSNKGSVLTDMGSNLGSVNLGTGTTAKSIAVGGYHSCAILNDKSVKCWGLNTSGQLGQGSVINLGDNTNEMGDHLNKIELGTGKITKSITAGFYHTCALLNDSKIKCWGAASSGQLGQHSVNSIGNNAGQMGDSLPTVDIGKLAASAISTGAVHSCAIIASRNTIKCWGASNNGQLGLGNTTNIGDNASEMGTNLMTVDLGTDTTTISTPTPIPPNTPTPLPQMTIISESLITPVAIPVDGETIKTTTIDRIVHPGESYILSDHSSTIYLEIPKYSWRESYQLKLNTSLENCLGTPPPNNAKILKCSYIQIYDYLGNPILKPGLWQNLTLRMILEDSVQDMPSGYLSTVVSSLKGEIRLQGYNPEAIGNAWIDLHNTTDRSEKHVSFSTNISNNRVVGLVTYEASAPQADTVTINKGPDVKKDSVDKTLPQATPTLPTIGTSVDKMPPDVGGHEVKRLHIAASIIIGTILAMAGLLLCRPRSLLD